MKRIAAIILFLSACLAQAQSIYVAQNAQGQNTGLDVADAYSLAWLNSSSNWGTGTGQVGPGTTVHLVGTLTNTLTAQGSGAPGNPITLYFESNAMFSAPTLPTQSSWITIQGGANNLVIDGGANGVLQLTDNGTVTSLGGTCDYGNTAIYGIYNAYLATNIVIQNLTISNLYNRQTNTDMTDSPTVLSEGICLQGGAGGNPAGWTVSNCVISGLHHSISFIFDSSGCSNCTITHCVVTNYAYGIGFSPTAVGAKFYNFFITHNVIQAGDMFEGNLNWHRNGIVSFGVEPDSATNICVSNIVIAYNNIGSGCHPDLANPHVSGGSSLMSIQQDLVQHLWVYNNVIDIAPGLSVSGESLWGNDFLFANNTVVSLTTNSSGVVNGVGGMGGDIFIPLQGNSNVFAFNNIICNSRKINIGTVATTNVVTVQDAEGVVNKNNFCAAYNVFNGNYANSGQSEYHLQINSNTFDGAISYSLYGYDNLAAVMAGLPLGNLWSNTTGETTTIQLDSNFIPLSTDTVAVGKGTNLTAWGITDDYAGNPRPPTGNWTIGAYQITDSNSADNIPIGVYNLSVTGSLPIAAAISSFVAGGGGGDITNGLLLWYKLNQTSGTATIDSSGNGYTGALAGNAGWTNGLAGTGAITFPSNNGALNSPDAVFSSAINYTGDWTIAFWVNNNSFPGGVNFAASLTGEALGAPAGILVGPAVYRFYDGVSYLNGSLALGSQAWYFIAVSKSGGTNYQLYLNGSTNGAGPLANNVPVSALYIGNNGAYGYSGMNGRIEDFRIYNRVLSGGEVSTLAANGPNDVAATLLTAPTNLHVISAGP
jgi:hypothetical protein